jgi:hypothetical protein
MDHICLPNDHSPGYIPFGWGVRFILYLDFSVAGWDSSFPDI